MQDRFDPTNFVREALECTVFLSPTDPGLTAQEILEAGHQVGFRQGELLDAFSVARRSHSGRLLPQPNPLWGTYCVRLAPERRNLAAFDFVYEELRNIQREAGIAKAQIGRAILVERATAKGLPRLDAEATVTILVMTQVLKQEDGVLRPNGRNLDITPSEQARHAEVFGQSTEVHAQVHAAVADVIARRTDGRRNVAEPLEAFGGELDKLGYGKFRLWWTQMVAELRRLDLIQSPVAVCVVSAALVEGVLTFIVKHARAQSLGAFGSTDFAEEPKRWKIEALVASAARGGESAVLTPPDHDRTKGLIKTRQRIHAGGMLSEYAGPTPIPDLRPEEARDAVATAELVVRRVLDWLARYPANAKPPER